MQTNAIGAVQKPFPTGLAPMLLEVRKEPFTEKGWLYEPKLDGMRCIAYVEIGRSKLLSKSGRDITDSFPTLAGEMSKLETGVYDGEIVAHGHDGKVSFERLQERWMLRRSREIAFADKDNPVTFYCYDLLYLNDTLLVKAELQARKALLDKCFKQGRHLKLVSYFDDGLTLFEACREQRFEGIVAKQLNSPYQCGTRSKFWQKVKYTQRGTFVIVGYKEDEGYLVAQKDRIAGFVQYGFSNADRKRLAELLELEKEEVQKGKRTLFYKPNVNVEIEFMEWTGRKLLRAPVFRALSQPNGLSIHPE